MVLRSPACNRILVPLSLLTAATVFSVTLHAEPSGEVCVTVGGAPAEALFVRRILRRARRAISRVARGVGRTVRNVATRVVRTARGVARAVGRGAVTVARSVGRAAGHVVRAAGKVVKAIGKGVIAVGKLAVKGITTLAGFIAKLGGPVLEAIKNKILGWLGDLARSKLRDFVGLIARAFGGNLRWLHALEQAARAATAVEQFLGKYVGKPVEVLDSILGKQHYLQYARDPNALINAAKQKLIRWVSSKVVDFAMSFVHNLAREVTRGLTELGLRLMSKPITNIIASLISKAIAAVTSGLGALLQPAINWALGQLMNRFAIPKLAERLVGLLVDKVSGWLQGKVEKLVGGAVNGIVDKIVGRHLQKWIDWYRRKTGKVFDAVERAAGWLRTVTDKAKAILATVGRVADAVRRLRDFYLGTCQGTLERCRAIAASYQEERRRFDSLRGKGGAVQALQAMVALRKVYRANACQYGRKY